MKEFLKRIIYLFNLYNYIRYGDMRFKILKILMVVWEKLENKRSDLYTTFFAQFIEITMIDHDRKFLISYLINLELRNLSMAMVFQTLLHECMEPKSEESFIVENIIINGIDKNLEKCTNSKRYSMYFELVMKKLVDNCVNNDVKPIISQKIKRISETLISLSQYKFIFFSYFYLFLDYLEIKKNTILIYFMMFVSINLVYLIKH